MYVNFTMMYHNRINFTKKKSQQVVILNTLTTPIKKQLIHNKLDKEIQSYTTTGKKIEVSCLLLYLIRYKASTCLLLKLPLQYMEIHTGIISLTATWFAIINHTEFIRWIVYRRLNQCCWYFHIYALHLWIQYDFLKTVSFLRFTLHDVHLSNSALNSRPISFRNRIWEVSTRRI